MAYPSIRRLTVTWLLLMALTGLTMVAGQVGDDSPLGLAGVAAVLLTAGFKSRQILMDFLNLRHSEGGWRVGFWSYLIVLGTAILAAYAAAA